MTKDEKVPNRIYLGSKHEFIRKDIILEKIEALKKANEVSDDEDYASYELEVACGYDMACTEILSFLRTFAEVDKHPKNVLAPSKECEPGLRESLESEKSSNGLEEEIKSWIPPIKVKVDEDVRGIMKHIREWGEQIARHFAEWGERKEKERLERMVQDYEEGRES